MVHSGTIPSIIGYRDNKPITWCSIAHRGNFASLEHSCNLKQVDDKPVWSIVCFYTEFNARESSLMEETIQGAVEYTRQNGARIVEAYPIEVTKHRPPGKLYMGNLNIFLKTGFEEMETRGTHKIVRWTA